MFRFLVVSPWIAYNNYMWNITYKFISNSTSSWKRHHTGKKLFFLKQEILFNEIRFSKLPVCQNDLWHWEKQKRNKTKPTHSWTPPALLRVSCEELKNYNNRVLPKMGVDFSLTQMTVGRQSSNSAPWGLVGPSSLQPSFLLIPREFCPCGPV